MIHVLRQIQNGRYFPHDIFKCIFVNEKVWISIKISLDFVPKRQINNITTLVQIMAWRRTGNIRHPSSVRYAKIFQLWNNLSTVLFQWHRSGAWTHCHLVLFNVIILQYRVTAWTGYNASDDILGEIWKVCSANDYLNFKQLSPTKPKIANCLTPNNQQHIPQKKNTLLNTRFTPNLGLTYDQKNGQTRGYSGVGRQGRMFLICFSPEGHRLLLNTRNNSGLHAIEIHKLRDRF